MMRPAGSLLTLCFLPLALSCSAGQFDPPAVVIEGEAICTELQADRRTLFELDAITLGNEAAIRLRNSEATFVCWADSERMKARYWENKGPVPFRDYWDNVPSLEIAPFFPFQHLVSAGWREKDWQENPERVEKHSVKTDDGSSIDYKINYRKEPGDSGGQRPLFGLQLKAGKVVSSESSILWETENIVEPITRTTLSGSMNSVENVPASVVTENFALGTDDSGPPTVSTRVEITVSSAKELESKTKFDEKLKEWTSGLTENKTGYPSKSSLPSRKAIE